jgi:hypothetical protein
LIEETFLPKKAFIKGNKQFALPTVFQVWQKKADASRDPKKAYTGKLRLC